MQNNDGVMLKKISAHMADMYLVINGAESVIDFLLNDNSLKSYKYRTLLISMENLINQYRIKSIKEGWQNAKLNKEIENDAN